MLNPRTHCTFVKLYKKYTTHQNKLSFNDLGLSIASAPVYNNNLFRFLCITELYVHKPLIL